MQEEAESPLITVVPGRDRVLRRVVTDALRRVADPSPDELARKLRPLYPRVAVFRRQVSGESAHLYVYRDGHYEREQPDRWWEADGIPCVCLSATTGRLTRVTDEWAQLMLGDPEALLGRHYSEFVVPDAREAARAMFEALREQGEVRSEALVVRGDGTTLAIEFRAVREDGEIDVRYRPLARAE